MSLFGKIKIKDEAEALRKSIVVSAANKYASDKDRLKPGNTFSVKAFDAQTKVDMQQVLEHCLDAEFMDHLEVQYQAAMKYHA